MFQSMYFIKMQIKTEFSSSCLNRNFTYIKADRNNQNSKILVTFSFLKKKKKCKYFKGECPAFLWIPDI